MNAIEMMEKRAEEAVAELNRFCSFIMFQTEYRPALASLVKGLQATEKGMRMVKARRKAKTPDVPVEVAIEAAIKQQRQRSREAK